MLSIEDIYRELGDNILVYPLVTDNFKDNSVDLTASRFAWSIENKIPESLYNEKTKSIEVPPHTTACILTNEAIYVGNNIGGTYHSRVSLVLLGFGHIGTMLDPKYCGQSLIMLHNITDYTKSIPVGERLVSVIFYYLNTPIVESTLTTPFAHLNKVVILDDDRKYQDWKKKHEWYYNAIQLKRHFDEQYSEKVKVLKERYIQKKTLKEKLLSSYLLKLVIKYVAVLLIASFLFWLSTRFISLSEDNKAGIVVGIISCLVTLMVSDIIPNKRSKS